MYTQNDIDRDQRTEVMIMSHSPNVICIKVLLRMYTQNDFISGRLVPVIHTTQMS